MRHHPQEEARGLFRNLSSIQIYIYIYIYGTFSFVLWKPRAAVVNRKRSATGTCRNYACGLVAALWWPTCGRSPCHLDWILSISGSGRRLSETWKKRFPTRSLTNIKARSAYGMASKSMKKDLVFLTFAPKPSVLLRKIDVFGFFGAAGGRRWWHEFRPAKKTLKNLAFLIYFFAAQVRDRKKLSSEVGVSSRRKASFSKTYRFA